MKDKMLIIGTEHPNVESLKWEEITEKIILGITDYQILLLNLESCSNVDTPFHMQKKIMDGVQKLLELYHKVIYLLPIDNILENYLNLLPITLSLKKSTGSSLKYQENDPIINFYQDYLHEHHSVILNAGNIGGMTWLIKNNIDEIVSFKLGSFYVLHQPDKQHYKTAIGKLVDYLDPELIEEDWEKPDWAYSYESDQLKTKEIQTDIDDIQNQIGELKLRQVEKEAEKQQISKWLDLLYTQGNTLEIRLKDAFELLGVDKVEHEPNKSHGPDLVIEHCKLAFTVEVEGTKGPIRIDKARELLHWIGDAPSHHKGLLIGNPFREKDPDDRPPVNSQLIGKEALALVVSRDLAFITSHDIFNLVCDKLNGNCVDISKVLEQINNNKGHITIK